MTNRGLVAAALSLLLLAYVSSYLLVREPTSEPIGLWAVKGTAPPAVPVREVVLLEYHRLAPTAVLARCLAALHLPLFYVDKTVSGRIFVCEYEQGVRFYLE